DRLVSGVFLTPCENNPAGRVNAALAKVILAEPVERKFMKAVKGGEIAALDYAGQLAEAVRKGLITAEEKAQLEELRRLTWDAISVDDFDHEDLVAASLVRGAKSGDTRRAA
ncbi:MAG: acyl-CoA dehydrogenase domain-containing protein, partial [Lysobacteraceae bacterium]